MLYQEDTVIIVPVTTSGEIVVDGRITMIVIADIGTVGGIGSMVVNSSQENPLLHLTPKPSLSYQVTTVT